MIRVTMAEGIPRPEHRACHTPGVDAHKDDELQRRRLEWERRQRRLRRTQDFGLLLLTLGVLVLAYAALVASGR